MGKGRGSMKAIRKHRNWPVFVAVFVIAAAAGILICDCCEASASPQTAQIQKSPCHSCCSHDMSIQASCSDAVSRVQSSPLMSSRPERLGNIFEGEFSGIFDHASRLQLDSTAEGPLGLPGSGFTPQPIYLSLCNLRI